MAKIKVHVDWDNARNLRPEAPIAIVGFPGSVQMKIIQTALTNQHIPCKYSVIGNMMIIFGINAGQLQEVQNLPGNTGSCRYYFFLFALGSSATIRSDTLLAKARGSGTGDPSASNAWS